MAISKASSLMETIKTIMKWCGALFIMDFNKYPIYFILLYKTPSAINGAKNRVAQTLQRHSNIRNLASDRKHYVMFMMV